MRVLILLLVLISFSTQVNAVEEVDKNYPFFRQFRSGFNLTFGAMSLVKSTQVLTDDESTNTELNISYGLTAIGILRLIDGFYFLFKESLPETYLKEGKLKPSHPNFKQNLNEARMFEKKLRRYRSTVIFLNGVGFFGLYNEDPDNNKLSLYPGITMMMVSAYAWFGKGPTEKAYDRILTTFNIAPNVIENKVVWGPQINLRF